MNKKEALEIVRKNYPHVGFSGSEFETALRELVPELEESEDERIRKELINFLQLPHPQFVGERKQEKWIAWLEKQGEQNHAWSEEDEERFQSCLYILQAKGFMGVTETINTKWLKSLKQRIGG